jgi:hypothetical protein
MRYAFCLLILTGLCLIPQTSFAGACEDQCYTDYWTCSDNCGAFGGALCEQQCTDALNGCLSVCPRCPTTRDYTVASVVSSQLTGRTACLQSPVTGYPYQEYNRLIHFVQYRETTACNGTKTTAQISDWYAYRQCWQQSSIFSCSPTIGSAFSYTLCN